VIRTETFLTHLPLHHESKMILVFRTLSYLATLMILACVGRATATELALHEGDNNPLAEGWATYRTFNNVITGPVTNDLGLGIDAWKVDDNGSSSGEGLYGQPLASQDILNAMNRGWKLSTKLRVVDATATGLGNGAVGVGFKTEGEFFSMAFGIEGDGSPLVHFYGTPIVVDLDDLDSGYHLYELVYSPSAGNADLFVDGQERYSDFPGVSGALVAPNVYFGSFAVDGAGHGNYSEVKFEVVPEPSSFVLAAITILSLAFYGWRRRKSQ